MPEISKNKKAQHFFYVTLKKQPNMNNSSGAGGTRTHDSYIKSVILYQLSYSTFGGVGGTSMAYRLCSTATNSLEFWDSCARSVFARLFNRGCLPYATHTNPICVIYYCYMVNYEISIFLFRRSSCHTTNFLNVPQCS